MTVEQKKAGDVQDQSQQPIPAVVVGADAPQLDLKTKPETDVAKVEAQQPHKVTEDEILAQVEQRTLDEIIGITLQERVAGIEAIYAQVKEAANKLLGSNDASVLGDASGILVVIGGKMQELKQSANPFFTWLRSLMRNTSWYVQKEIKLRQSIKTILEENNTHYRMKRDALLRNLSDIEDSGKAAQDANVRMDIAMAQLTHDIDVLEKAQKAGGLEQETAQTVQAAVQYMRTLKSDLAGAKVVNENSIIDTYMQLTNRQQLYIRIGSILPILDSLTRQQLANLISRKPLREAAESIEMAKKSLSSLVKQTSDQMVADSTKTAELINVPLVDDKTIREVSDNVIKMCDGVRTIVDGAKDQHEQYQKIAKEAYEKMDNRLEEFHQGK